MSFAVHIIAIIQKNTKIETITIVNVFGSFSMFCGLNSVVNVSIVLIKCKIVVRWFVELSFRTWAKRMVSNLFIHFAFGEILLSRVTKVSKKTLDLACQFQQVMFSIPYKYIEYEAHSHRLVRFRMYTYLQTDLSSLQWNCMKCI